MADPLEEIDDTAYDYTIGMNEDEIDERMREGSIGVLSLADGGNSYAIPVAYYYDGKSVYIRLGIHSDSTKAEMLQTTDTACFLLYDAEPIEESWSVIVTGPIRRIDDPSQFSDAVINSLFVPLRVFGERIEDLDQTIFELEIESITGRRAADS